MSRQLQPKTQPTAAGDGLAFLLVRASVAVAWWGTLLAGPVLLVLLLSGEVPGMWFDVRVDLDEPLFVVASSENQAPSAPLEELSGKLYVSQSDLGFLGWGSLLAGYAIAVFILAQVRGLVTSLRTGPFVAGNAARLERIGWTLLAMNLAEPLVQSLTNDRLAGIVTPHLGSVWIPTDLQLENFIYPLFFLLLAQVFRIGVRLEEEQALVV